MSKSLAADKKITVRATLIRRVKSLVAASLTSTSAPAMSTARRPFVISAFSRFTEESSWDPSRVLLKRVS